MHALHRARQISETVNSGALLPGRGSSSKRSMRRLSLAPAGAHHRTPARAEAKREGEPMNILILGGGGREHALAWAFAQNPKCDRLWCAPGNAGIAEEATASRSTSSTATRCSAFAPRERHRLRDGRPRGAAGRGRRRRAARRRRPRPSGRPRRRRGSRPRRPSPRRSAPPAARRPPPSQTFTDRAGGPRLCRSRRARRSWSRPTASPPARA